MLSVCYMWRQTALEYLWRELLLLVDEENGKAYNCRPEWVELYWQLHVSENLVRELSVSVQRESIFSGVGHELLSEYMGSTTILPHVRKLRILISDEVGQSGFATGNAITNALQFADLLKLMTPAVSSVEVKFDEGLWSLGKDDERVLGVFLKSIYGKATYAMLDAKETGLRHLSTVELIPQLTTLTLFYVSTIDVHISLVHKCAKTLLSLDIALCGAKELLYDVNGNGVIYSNMQY
ncbi:hypothetical protein GGI10_005907, partial [Coemansia sp. RSA 2530]